MPRFSCFATKILPMIQAQLDHKIRVNHRDLEPEIAKQIVEALSIPNLAKLEACKQKLWDWQSMPDTIPLWADDGEHLVMPRGFAHDLLDGLEAIDESVEWIDQRTWEPFDTKMYDATSSPKRWQVPQIQAILDHQQGILKAPAGSGKTVTILLAIAELACKSLVIVNTKDIVWQWQERVHDHLGEDFPVGQVGDGIFDVSPGITIATAQTLHRRFDVLESEGFFDEFSFICLDECFPAGTLISAPDGPRPIESLRTGDAVYGIN